MMLQPQPTPEHPHSHHVQQTPEAFDILAACQLEHGESWTFLLGLLNVAPIGDEGGAVSGDKEPAIGAAEAAEVAPVGGFVDQAGIKLIGSQCRT